MTEEDIIKFKKLLVLPVQVLKQSETTAGVWKVCREVKQNEMTQKPFFHKYKNVLLGCAAKFLCTVT